LIQKSEFLVTINNNIVNNEQALVTTPQSTGATSIINSKRTSFKNHELKANRNMTLMVICTSALYSKLFK